MSNDRDTNGNLLRMRRAARRNGVSEQVLTLFWGEVSRDARPTQVQHPRERSCQGYYPTS